MRPNWLFIAGFASCFVVPLVYLTLPLNPRLTAAGMGMVAIVALAYQGVANYQETQTTGRIAVLLIIASLLIVSIGQVLLPQDADDSVATYALIGQRWGCILFALCYRRLLGLGHRSPWVRPREAHENGVSRPNSGQEAA